MKGKKPKLGAEERVVLPTADKLPEPPHWMDGEAADSWIRMSQNLKDAGLLVMVARDKLIRYCIAWSDWSEAVQEKRGTTKPRNWSADFRYMDKCKEWRDVMKEAERVMQSFEREYGLTPAAAMSIKRPAGGGQLAIKAPHEELAEFLDDEKETEE